GTQKFPIGIFCGNFSVVDLRTKFQEPPPSDYFISILCDKRPVAGAPFRITLERSCHYPIGYKFLIKSMHEIFYDLLGQRPVYFFCHMYYEEHTKIDNLI